MATTPMSPAITPRPGAPFNTADIFDSAPDRVEVCNLHFIDYGGRPRYAGPCSILRATTDASAIRMILDEPGNGGILVIDGRPVPDCACFGDSMAKLAIAKGWAGVIVAGLVRDVAMLQTLPFGVRALGSTARRPFGPKEEREHDVCLNIAGAHFRPGAMVYVDSDAVIVLQDARS